MEARGLSMPFFETEKLEKNGDFSVGLNKPKEFIVRRDEGDFL